MAEPQKGKVKSFGEAFDKTKGVIIDEKGCEVYFRMDTGPEVNERLPKKGDQVIFDFEVTMGGYWATAWTFAGGELPCKVPVWTGEKPPQNSFIIENLKRFGIEDFEVVGGLEVTRIYDKLRVEVGPMLVSQLCGDFRRLIKKRPSDELGFSIAVMKDGVHIGNRDSDGRFHFRAAPDLRTALGWAVATDLGSSRVLRNFDLDAGTTLIKNAVQAVPVAGTEDALSKYFSRTFTPAVGQVISYQATSRFADSHFSWAHLFWALSCKEVHGREVSHGKTMFLS